jgi:hypothetical protein
VVPGISSLRRWAHFRAKNTSRVPHTMSVGTESWANCRLTAATSAFDMAADIRATARGPRPSVVSSADVGAQAPAPTQDSCSPRHWVCQLAGLSARHSRMNRAQELRPLFAWRKVVTLDQ